MSDLVARLRVNGTSLYDQAADRIEALEAELAAANAKIEAVREIHHAHSVLTGECVSCRGLVPCRTIRALSATPQGSLAGDDMSDKRSTIYKCVCQFSGTNVKTRKNGDDDYWTCPRCQIEYGPMLPYSLGPQRPFAGSTIREENGTTGGGPIVDPEC